MAALVGAGDPPSDAEVEAWIREATNALVARAERYEADPPVGRLPEDRLAAWQEEERARLLELYDSNEGVEWPYEGVYRVGPRGAIPSGYRVGGTAIVGEALLNAPGLEDDEERRAVLARAAEFILERLDSDATMEPFQDRAGRTDLKGRAADHRRYDVRGWGHTYALSFLLRGIECGVFKADLEQRARRELPNLIGDLAAGEGRGGGWNYASGASTSPFQTGATLLVLYRARAAGVEVPDGLVERALAALERGRRLEDRSWGYSVRPGEDGHTERQQGSSARSAVAELALALAGRGSEQGLVTAVDGFFQGWDDLLARKSKQGTHEGPFGIAPYYFFFGHGYVAQAIEALPSELGKPRRVELLERLARTRDSSSGTWNDRIFPRTSSYGTAMALTALLAPRTPQVPEWIPGEER